MKKEKNYELLPIQKGILFHTLKEKTQKTLYLIQIVIQITEIVQSDKFIDSWKQVISRHDVLRSYISWSKNGAPILKVSSEINFILKQIDVSNLSPNLRNKTLTEFTNSELNSPINLDKAPLFRLYLIKFSEKEYYLIWTIHHIIIEVMRAMNTIIKEVFTIYDEVIKGNQTPSLPPPKSYQEVFDIILQQPLLGNTNYWKQLLLNYEALSALPQDGKRNSESNKQSFIKFQLNQQLFNELKMFIEDKPFSLNTMVLAAWGIILSKLVQRTDIVFGTVRAYPSKLINDCAGIFINALPIRVNFHAKTTILDYLANVREQQGAIRDHIHTPLYEIQRICNLPDNTELFSSLIDFKYSALDQFGRGRKVSYTTVTNYPLVIEVIVEKESFYIHFHYDTGLFSEFFIKQLYMLFAHIFKTLLENPLGLVKDIALITSNDELSLKKIQIDTCTYNVHDTIVSRFKKIATQHPYRTAIYARDRILSYREIDNLSDAFASYFKQHNVYQPQKIIAICLLPNPDTFITILAILKLGCAYLPIDPKLPVSRIRYMLTDSKVTTLVYSAAIRSKIKLCLEKNSVSEQIKTILISQSIYQKLPLQIKYDPIQVKPTDVAYIIYTSGTTGLAKGVLVEHQSVVNMAQSHINNFKISPEDRILQYASLSFDVSVAEWSMALLSGASITIISEEEKRIGEPLKEFLYQNHITIAMFTTATLKTLPTSQLPELRLLVCGGEPCTEHILKRWGQDRKFVIAYGVTEATVCSTMNLTSSQVTVIGKPIDNTQVYILDEHNHPLSIGFTGEICIGGIGLARKYTNQDNMLRFIYIEDPLDRTKQIRLYRTGDQGRWLSTGDIEYLGRQDRQIKVAGYQIDLTEIENCILRNKQIQSSTVIAEQQDENSRKTIIAYLVLKNQSNKIDLKELRSKLSQQLPYYMIPTDFIIIDKMPLTINGKIDSSALPKRTSAFITNNQSLAENQLEQIISKIYQEQMMTNELDINKNIFDLGAHSVMIMGVHHILENKFNLHLELTDFFKYPTIKKLAKHLSEQNNIIKETH